ncbi:MAG: cytochrome c biogenesis protein CcdA [Rhodospirillaceae bacterium]|jgi:cytochrome c-type biogenesis protein|nr:cytochrome c biogenesis protein CcdA [Rhodospirillaceae bacterium]
MGGFDVSYAGALGAGILSFLSPCVLPLVPPYLCFLGGVTLDQVAGDDEADPQLMRRVFIAAIAFVLGFSTVFVALGATASAIGQVVADYMDLLSKIAGGVIIVMGLHFMGVFKISMLYREARFHAESKPAGVIGAYIIGLAFAFGWTPCVGPVLAAILFVAGSEDSVTRGASLLAVYSAGLGIPFLAAALLVKPFMAFMGRARKHMQMVERVMGALLVITGIMFLTGTVADVAFWLLETFPALGKTG